MRQQLEQLQLKEQQEKRDVGDGDNIREENIQLAHMI